ncbi:probable 28S ribosomal protein S25, mitochondrial [Patella vulgata]|uniref:probable 28S ribosomal protein S25, mitochondrial n=1 Tax=Patella vulgata TaxID=6465 RepID=UPI00217FB3D0|nr:probable 28S ribosomal protein S25, mitochondrial [Patella vulgata]
MPFMKGRAAIRRTLQYLERGSLVLNDSVQIMTVNYNSGHKASRGTYDFIFWYLGQVQFKNPSVQILTFKNMTPSPYISFYLDNGEKILVDADSRDKDEIYQHIKTVLGKSEEDLQKEALAREKKANPANFGHGYSRWCICEIPGQIPCPGWVPLPKEMRGKYNLQKKDVEV